MPNPMNDMNRKIGLCSGSSHSLLSSIIVSYIEFADEHIQAFSRLAQILDAVFLFISPNIFDDHSSKVRTIPINTQHGALSVATFNAGIVFGKIM
jgi:hypothetical protein